MILLPAALSVAGAVAGAVALVIALTAAQAAAAQVVGDPESLFEPLRSVMQHPRCQNCHAPGDTPLQSDRGTAHIPAVRRGPEGKGTDAVACTTCHLDRNARSPLLGREVPGAPDWHMPPRNAPMIFAGTAPRTLCETLKDRAANGGRSLEDLGRHMTMDSLLAWAWQPGGGRTIPPLTKPEFDAAAIAWLRAGAPCP